MLSPNKAHMSWIFAPLWNKTSTLCAARWSSKYLPWLSAKTKGLLQAMVTRSVVAIKLPSSQLISSRKAGGLYRGRVTHIGLKGVEMFSQALWPMDVLRSSCLHDLGLGVEQIKQPLWRTHVPQVGVWKHPSGKRVAGKHWLICPRKSFLAKLYWLRWPRLAQLVWWKTKTSGSKRHMFQLLQLYELKRSCLRFIGMFYTK